MYFPLFKEIYSNFKSIRLLILADQAVTQTSLLVLMHEHQIAQLNELLFIKSEFRVAEYSTYKCTFNVVLSRICVRL